MAISARISPTKAILICINSMIGAGIFINTKPLAELAGAFGFLSYLVAAIILLPLIICIAELAALHPVAGGLYVYSKTYLGAWAGFISGWAYFVGKTTSVAILMHKFVQFFQPRVALLSNVPTIAIDFTMLFLLALLNINGVFVGGRIQYLFTILKAIPIIFVFLIGFLYGDINNFNTILFIQDFLCTLPIAIFPLLGFEVICAIGNLIENAADNIKRVILSAFFLVAGIDILFQFSSFFLIGTNLASINEPVLMIGLKIFTSYPVIASIINGAVFTSIIGSCFSILTSNCWNLHTVALNGHLPGKSFLTMVNQCNVPVISLLIEAMLGCFILLITLDQVPLQNMAVFAQIISLAISSLSAWYATRMGVLKLTSNLLPLLALASSAFIILICLQRLFISGISMPFLIILSFGGILALIKHYIID